MLEPIKPKLLTRKPYPLPKGLIYKHMENDYSLAETTTGKMVGYMFAKATVFDPNFLYKKKEKDKIFYIHTLEIKPEEQSKGWGKYFMAFAKSECEKEGCEGRLSLIAFNEQRSPHVFYWKQGLRTKNSKINAQIKNCIDKSNTNYFFDVAAMYIPIEEKIENNIIKKLSSKKILKKFKIFFGHNK